MSSLAHVFLIARSAAGEQPKKMTAALENAARDLDPDVSMPTAAYPVSPECGSGKTAWTTS